LSTLASFSSQEFPKNIGQLFSLPHGDREKTRCSVDCGANQFASICEKVYLEMRFGLANAWGRYCREKAANVVQLNSVGRSSFIKHGSYMNKKPAFRSKNDE